MLLLCYSQIVIYNLKHFCSEVTIRHSVDLTMILKIATGNMNYSCPKTLSSSDHSRQNHGIKVLRFPVNMIKTILRQAIKAVGVVYHSGLATHEKP